MLNRSVSFVDRMVGLLPYKPDVPGSIPGVGPDFFQLFFKLKTKSSQIQSPNNPMFYPDTLLHYLRVMDNFLSLTLCEKVDQDGS